MSKDLSEITDDYCMENYGHMNWGYLDTYSPKELADQSKYNIEDGKVFWYKPYEDVESDYEVIWRGE